MPGACEIMKLRQQLASKSPGPRASWKAKLPVKRQQSAGKHKNEAKKLYGATSSSSVLDALRPSAMDAFEELVALLFKGHKGKCESWKGKLSEPETYSYEGHLYVRCQNWQCQQRYNVTHFSVFRGTRLKLPDLLKVVVFYARGNRLKPPRVSEATAQLKLGRYAVSHIYSALLTQEAMAGEAFSAEQQRLAGNVEGDAHTIRKVYVSTANPLWVDQVADAAKRWRRRNGNKPQPKYWLGHVRVAGLKQRDGLAVVVVLPTRLVPPKSSPPEGRQELKSSGLMNHVDTAHGKKTLLHSDGAQAWPKLVADVGKK